VLFYYLTIVLKKRLAPTFNIRTYTPKNTLFVKLVGSVYFMFTAQFRITMWYHIGKMSNKCLYAMRVLLILRLRATTKLSLAREV